MLGKMSGDNEKALDDVLGPADETLSDDPVAEVAEVEDVEMSPEETLGEVSRMVEEMTNVLKRAGI